MNSINHHSPMAYNYSNLFEQQLENKNQYHFEVNYAYNGYYTNNYNNPTDAPSYLINKLIEENFNFTQDHFDKFLIAATYKKSSCYLVRKSNVFPDEQHIAITTMFSKFTPNNKQLKNILSCYAKGGSLFSWIDTLLSRDIKLDDATIDTLIKVGYKSLNIFKQKDTPKSPEDILKMLPAAQPSDLPNLQQIIADNNIAFTDDNLITIMATILPLKKADYYHRQIRHNQPQERYNFIEFLLNSGTKVTQKVLQYYFNYVDNSMSMMSFPVLFLKYDYRPTKDDVLCAIDNRDFTAALYMLELSVSPDLDILNRYLQISYKLKINIFNDLNKKTGFSSGIIKNHIETNNRSFFDYMITRGVKPTDTTMQIACAAGLQNTVIKLIKLGLAPDKSCLDAILQKKQKIEDIKLILDFKIIPDYTSLKSLCKQTQTLHNINDFIELLITYGLNIDLKCLNLIISKNLHITNLERFNIAHDEELYYICHKNMHFPQEYIDKFTIDKNIITLRDLCKTAPDVATIADFMEAHNLALDLYCLENLCTTHKNAAYKIMTNYHKKFTTRSMAWWCIDFKDQKKYYHKEDLKKKLTLIHKLDKTEATKMTTKINITPDQLRDIKY
jgi:hypothetical protein